MRYLSRILLLLLLTRSVATAQEPRPTVESVEISGVPEDEISQALRGMIQRLVGERFDQQTANDLADRIRAELAGFTASVRQDPGSQPDRVKVVFIVEYIEEDHRRLPNINARYTVESVEISGISDFEVSDELRADMQKLVGEKLNQEAAGRIQRRIWMELRRANYGVSRKVIRGSRRDHVKVIFEIKKVPRLAFRDLPGHLIYHSKQNFSLALDAPIQVNDHRFNLGAANDGDELLERYAGFRFGYENKKVGTDHFGIRLDYFTYHQKWQPSTRLASEQAPEIPVIYRARRSFEPSITFAFDPRLKISVGASITELQLQFPAVHSENSNAGVASLNYLRDWEDFDGHRHVFEANYHVRTAARNLDSAFVYTRHFGEARYVYERRRTRFTERFFAGQMSGSAPLFERFSLGNTSTLRGWNKFDLIPLGADRVAHNSMEYNYEPFQIFYDTGGVWNKGAPIKFKHSVGLGFRIDDWFATIAVPIRSADVKAIFMTGIRF